MQQRLALALILAVAFPLAGCSSPPASPPATPPAGPPAMTNATLPEDIDETMDVTAGVDPFNFAMQPICSQQVSTCFPHPFNASVNVSLTATLTWTLQASDFDLYLYQGNTAVAMSAGMPPSTQEAFTVPELAAGDYTLIVVAWSVPKDTYHLTATFALAPSVAGNATAPRA